MLSELLQNADDADATEARAYIDDDVFVFEHNGKDFNEDQFASLCRFGFSNKRSIHTIGFRGVGFKSTFSLGPTVDVLTPSLAIEFTRERFTEPTWIQDAHPQECTRICIKIEDVKRKKELEKNLSEWSKSPASLLFFQSIKSLDIAGRVFTKKSLGDGPIRNSERISLEGADPIQVMVIHSEEEPFPPEAVDEIKKERIIDDISLPPCRVDIILGLKGDQRLFVVLPTGVRPNIPFSCNAPFIQDPARSGIKDPSISDTNQWLLQRIGNLAEETMMTWLQDKSLPIPERCKAYDLLPQPGDEGDTIEGECTSKIKESFASIGSDKPLLLASDGTMRASAECLVPPRMLYGIWSSGEIINTFGNGKKSILAEEVTSDHRKKLEAWKWLELLSTDAVLKRLEGDAAVPKPGSWPALALLWSAIRQWVTYDYNDSTKKRLKIVPVKGDAHLHSATTTVRVAAGKTDLRDDEWAFITSRLKALDPAWADYVNQKKDPEIPGKDYVSSSTLTSLLTSLGLAYPSQIESLVLR
ncbi:MAG TPA: ATP-binding protein, partial [Bacteroidales bacterium]|nr:ATP-binding protein [Bacteroidales bacterium]